MKKIIFATNNLHKLSEVQAMLDADYKLVIPRELGITEDIPETSDTIAGNASQKSHYLYDKTAVDCFADDTGLEVTALGGAPGVHSARYASLEKSDEKNIDLLLHNLHDTVDRSARFRTVISLIHNGEEHQFEGVVEGTIIDERRGTEGFGYDPVFVPDGYSQTFAEMDATTKNRLSHRGRAVAKLVEFLKNNRL